MRGRIVTLGIERLQLQHVADRHHVRHIGRRLANVGGSWSIRGARRAETGQAEGEVGVATSQDVLIVRRLPFARAPAGEIGLARLSPMLVIPSAPFGRAGAIAGPIVDAAVEAPPIEGPPIFESPIAVLGFVVTAFPSAIGLTFRGRALLARPRLDSDDTEVSLWRQGAGVVRHAACRRAGIFRIGVRR